LTPVFWPSTIFDVVKSNSFPRKVYAIDGLRPPKNAEELLIATTQVQGMELETSPEVNDQKEDRCPDVEISADIEE